MPRDRNLKKIVESLSHTLENEEVDFRDLASFPALARLRNQIQSQDDLLKRLWAASAGGGDCDLSRDSGFLTALERELVGETEKALARDLRRTLNAVLHLTRFGRNGEVFKQALMSLFLLDKEAVHSHPLVRQMVADAIAHYQEKTDLPPKTLSRDTLLETYALKKRLEYRRMDTADLVSELSQMGPSPPEELMAELLRRGPETLVPVKNIVFKWLDEEDENSWESVARAFGPACGILGEVLCEVKDGQAVEALVRCLRVDPDEDIALALAKVGDGALEGLQGMLEDVDEDPDVRVQSVVALSYLAYLHPEMRDGVVKAFRSILAHEVEDDPEVYEWVIHGLGELRAAEASQDAIRKPFERGWMEESELTLEDALKGGDGWVTVEDAEEDLLDRYRYVDEMWDEDWAEIPDKGPDCFGGDLLEPREPVRVGEKVGRNDPCPCGSGKKFKRCCGQ